MISFLNGFILPALFAATIPLILHFLSKKKAVKIPFSSLKFLKIIENKRVKKVKLYQILLIIVRTLFIIFLVLAFSRPTISNYSSGTSNAQTTAFILLDDSYSMQSFAYSKTYFEIAKEKVDMLLSSFSNDDNVFLYCDAMEKPVEIIKDNSQQILSKLSAGNKILNFKKDLSIADSIFKKHLNLNNELYLISDFKIHKQNGEYTSLSDISNFRAYGLEIGRNIPFKNISIDTVIFENQLYEIGKPFDIKVQLTNHDNEVTETNLNLFNGSERTAMEFISLQGNETKNFIVKYIPKNSGLHFLKLQLDEDDLSLDNNWYFSFFMRDKISVLFISDNTSEQMNTALKILSANTIFNFTQVHFTEWPGINLDNFDLLILNGLKNMDKNAISRLKNYISSNHSIVIIPGTSADLETYNNFFKSLIKSPLFLALKNAGNNGFYSLENQKTANVIFDALFRDKRSSFSPPKVYKYFQQKNYNKSLVRLSNNDPYITQSGPLIVFSTSFDITWSDMEINGLFLPLLYRSFYHAAQNKNPVQGMQNIGNNITFVIPGATINKNYMIQNPAGKRFTVIPKPVENNLLFNGGKSNEDGFYTLLDDNKPVTTIAVNHSSAEFKKPYINDDDLAFKIKSLNNDNFIEQIQSSRVGFELWFIFLVLAFLMLLAEMLIIKIIEGTPFLRKV